MKSWLFFTISIGCLFGMIIAMFIAPDKLMNHIGLIIAALIIWLFFCKKNFTTPNSLYVIITFLVCAAMGFLRTDYFHNTYSFTDLDSFNNQTIIVVGKVSETPSFKPGVQLVKIHPESINGEKSPLKTRDIVLRFSDLVSISAGDTLIASGKFSTRGDFKSDNGRIVQYRLMSYARKVSGDIYSPKLISIHQADNNVYAIAASLKRKFMQTLNELFSSPASGLLSGIVIGDTSGLDTTMLDLFRAVGLIHIVVLSGYNITLIANFFARLFSPLGYYRRIVFAMVSLTLFIIIVGISPTSIRAGIMALCAFSARYFIRPYSITRSLTVALLIMVWISPYSLLFDLSLQLSFLATIGIVYMFPFFQDRFPQLAEHTLGEILLQTTAVNMVTLPVIIYQIGVFSLISFPVNILVLSSIPWITIGTFGAVLIGMILIPFGKLLAFPIQVITNTIITFTTWTAQHDPFKITFPVFSVYWMLGVYVIIFLLLFKLVKSKK